MAENLLGLTREAYDALRTNGKAPLNTPTIVLPDADNAVAGRYVKHL